MAPDDPDDPAEHEGGAELRGKDLLSRPREELAQALDPATLAQLASWFDRPSAVVVAEQAAAAVAEDEEARELREQQERQARAMAAAEPWLIARLEAHNLVPDRLVPPRPPVRIHLDERVIPVHVRAALDLREADAPPDARAFEQPPDIAAAIERDNAPQAILRDLYRPVADFERRLEPMFDPEEAAPMFQVGRALEPREPIEWVGRALDALIEARARFRAIADQPWDQHHAAVKAALAAMREGAS